MTKRLDPDFRAIKDAVRALQRSSSLRMLRANMEYLIDRFLARPDRAELKRIAAASRPLGESPQ